MNSATVKLTVSGTFTAEEVLARITSTLVGRDWLSSDNKERRFEGEIVVNVRDLPSTASEEALARESLRLRQLPKSGGVGSTSAGQA